LIIEKIGISDAINIFLHKVQKVGRLPFEMRDKEPTNEEILEGLKEAVEEVNLYNQGKLKFKTLDAVLEEL
jgi:antitoxin component of RelBE/YafQ-DinJ toxin-antitoxin module